MAAVKQRNFPPELKAQIIAESVASGIKATCEKYDISRRSMERWKKQLKTGDATLSQLVAGKLEKVERDWLAEIPSVLVDTVAFLQRAAKEADPKDPDAIHAVAGAFKLMADVINARDFMADRLGQSQQATGTRATTGAAGSVPRPPTADNGVVAH